MIQKRTENWIAEIKNTYLCSSIFGVYDGGNETSFFLIILHSPLPAEELDSLVKLDEKYN